jgi:hypothetical protein
MLKDTINRTAKTDAEIYRAIIARHESPKPGDDAELHRVMQALNIGFDEVAADCSAYSEHARLEAPAASLEDARALTKTFGAKVAAFEARRAASVAAFDAEANELAAEKGKAHGSLVKCNNAAVRRGELERAHPRIFTATIAE